MDIKQSIQKDVDYLTSDIEDVENKPHLKTALKSFLIGYGHDKNEIDRYLNNFFYKELNDGKTGNVYMWY